MVALETAGDDILPGFSAAFDDGIDVIKGQILRVVFLAAVLAGIVIARVDIGSAEFDMLEMLSDLYILQEPEDTGHSYGKADAPDLAIILGQNFNFPLV
jgi:hypothetical protein